MKKTIKLDNVECDCIYNDFIDVLLLLNNIFVG